MVRHWHGFGYRKDHLGRCPAHRLSRHPRMGKHGPSNLDGRAARRRRGRDGRHGVGARGAVGRGEGAVPGALVQQVLRRLRLGPHRQPLGHQDPQRLHQRLQDLHLALRLRRLQPEQRDRPDLPAPRQQRVRPLHQERDRDERLHRDLDERLVWHLDAAGWRERDYRAGCRGPRRVLG